MRRPRWLGGPSAHEDRYIDDWLKGIERGLSTATGIRVTVEEALRVPGIAACIQVQSEDLAKVPLDLKRRTDAGYEPATDHPLYSLLKYGPAPWLSPYAWRASMVHGAMARGNHYSMVRRDIAYRLDRITPLQAGATAVRWADDGEPFFDVTIQGRTQRGLAWHDIIHVAYRASDLEAANGGVTGVSPITQNKETVALMIAAERFAGTFFANGARPSVVLEMDKKLPNDDVARRMRASIERVYSGLSNQWKIAILELGMKMREFSTDPQKSQLIETRRHCAELACAMYRTPPHKIGILDRATNNNIEHQSIDYITGPLSALARSVEAGITTACLSPPEREEYKVEHNLEGLMRGDILSRYRAYAIGRQWGWLSANDVLGMENRNGIGASGDEYLVPLNMAPGGDAAPGENQRDQQAAGKPALLLDQWGKRLSPSASWQLPPIDRPDGPPTLH